MTASVEQFINSPAAIRFVFSAAKAIPPRLGYSIARSGARWLSSRRDSDLVRAIRANQWMVGGEKNSPRFLDAAAQVVLRNSARSIYELYHYIDQPDMVAQMYSFDPSFQAYVVRPEFDRRGIVVVGLHMAGFDLALQWLGGTAIKPMVLTIPKPEGGRRLEFEVRQKTGMNLIPATIQGLRQAVRYLQQGGLVVTGLDRPVPQPNLRPRFFGRPASLPMHFVYLALKAQVPVAVIFCSLEPDGKYHIYVSPPIEMERCSSRADEMLINTEKVLAVAEGFIQHAPQQWVVPLPVWPEIIHDVPR